MNLPAKTVEVYRFCLTIAGTESRFPTMREICDACRISSTSVVADHLERLEAKNLIVKSRPGRYGGHAVPEVRNTVARLIDQSDKILERLHKFPCVALAPDELRDFDSAVRDAKVLWHLT